jgi:Arf-GAP/SH3 domain/ANK repeat/PH domain-containing protein
VLNTSKNDALDKELYSPNPNTANAVSSNTNSNRNEPKMDSYEKHLDNLVRETIKKVVRIEGNDKCCDCGSPEPDWLVTNLGILVCIECCGIHRKMGVQIAKTQSIKIDRLSCSQLIVSYADVKSI